MGKTSTVAMLAMKFVAKEEDMKKFDFVWIVRLKNVDKTSNLAEIVRQQHQKLKTFSVGQVASILVGKTESKVALLFDGYDEYQPGKNKDIDTAIESGVGNCILVLTSRPGYVSDKVKETMDIQVNIEGLSPANIKKCCEQYLDSSDKRRNMLKQAAKAGIFYHKDGFLQKLKTFIWEPEDELLRIPIILLMVCFIFEQNKSLPKSKTETIKTLYELLSKRSEVRGSEDNQQFSDSLFKLGKLSWESLMEDKLFFKKVCSKHHPVQSYLNICVNVLKL